MSRKDIIYPDANDYGARQTGPTASAMKSDRGPGNDTRHLDHLPDLVNGGYQSGQNARRDNVTILDETPNGVIIEGEYRVSE